MSAVATIPRLITPGVIAAELNVPLHRVLNVLATRKHIQPSARAGTLRLYDRRSVELVRQELAAIDRRRSQRTSRQQSEGVGTLRVVVGSDEVGA